MVNASGSANSLRVKVLFRRFVIRHTTFRPTMTWLNVTEYLCHKCPLICSVCRNHNPVRVYTMGATAVQNIAERYKCPSNEQYKY
jgi:hypothetical protein